MVDASPFDIELGDLHEGPFPYRDNLDAHGSSSEYSSY